MVKNKIISTPFEATTKSIVAENGATSITGQIQNDLNIYKDLVLNQYPFAYSRIDSSSKCHIMLDNRDLSTDYLMPLPQDENEAWFNAYKCIEMDDELDNLEFLNNLDDQIPFENPEHALIIRKAYDHIPFENPNHALKLRKA